MGRRHRERRLSENFLFALLTTISRGRMGDLITILGSSAALPVLAKRTWCTAHACFGTATCFRRSTPSGKRRCVEPLNLGATRARACRARSRGDHVAFTVKPSPKRSWVGCGAMLQERRQNVGCGWKNAKPATLKVIGETTHFHLTERLARSKKRRVAWPVEASPLSQAGDGGHFSLMMIAA
jgi:hypothetical protein